MDSSGDGQISRREFREGMTRLGLEVDVKEIGALFDEWDLDKDGVLSFDELKLVLSGPRKATTQHSTKEKKEKRIREKFSILGKDFDIVRQLV